MSKNYKSNIDNVKKKITAVEIDALNKIGIFVEGQAKLRCPVGNTGWLRARITNKVDEDKKSVTIGTNVDYAVYVEKGTGIYAEDGNGRKTAWLFETENGETVVTRGQKPQPYLTPAVENNLDKIRKIAKTELSKVDD